MSNKIGVNKPCPCGKKKPDGSTIKYKKCCMNQNKYAENQVGVLKLFYEGKPGDDFMARMLFQMSEIKNCVYSLKEREAYDKSYHPIFQNLLEAKQVKERYEEKLFKHIDDVKNGLDGIRNGQQLDIKTPIESDLNIYFKDFFIRGTMTIDCLIRHARFMGYNIGFLFADDEKKYKDGLNKFPLDESDMRFQSLEQIIKQSKKSWYTNFKEMRRKIVHDGYSLPELKYEIIGSKVNVVATTINNQTTFEILNICWENLFQFCEEIIILLLSLKLDKDLFIIKIDKEHRDKNLPIKYEVKHRFFPEANFSC